MVTLLNAALLPWIAAVSVPLVIHLLTRRTRRRLDLPTVKFLQRTLANQSKLFKWRHLLLLLIRTMAAAALIFTFLKPMLNSPLAAASSDRVGIVVVLDVSASMSYSAGGLTSLARAKSEALVALQGLRSGDKANVVLCGAHPQAILPEPTRDFSALQNAVRAIRPTEERADPAAAINVAVEQLAKANAPAKRLFLLSDFQRTNWADVKLESVGPDTKVLFVNTDAGSRDNAGIVSIKLRPSSPRVGEAISVLCEVFNASPSAKTLPVTLSLSSGGRYAQTVAVGPYSSATASFPLRFDSPQRVECTATIPADNLALDDTRRVVIDLRQVATVVLITDEDSQKAPAGAFFLSHALHPDPQMNTGFHVIAVKPAHLNNPILQSADVVIVCDATQMPAVQYEALARYVGGGGNLVWFLYGERIAEQLKELSTHMPSAEPLPFHVERVADLSGNGKGYVTLAEARYESPLLKAFKDPTAADLGRIKFRRLCVTGEVDRRAETLLKFEDDTAAAIRASVGSGSLLLLNTSPAPEWSDLARQEAFVPLMHELLKGMLLRDSETREFVAGGAASATIPRAPTGKTLSVACAGPQGIVPVTVEPTTGSVVIDQAALSGFYRLTSEGAPAAAIAVNTHADETDLRQIDPRELESQRQKNMSFMAGMEGQYGGVEDLNKGRPLWQYTLFATVLLLFAEQCLGRLRPKVGSVAR